MNLQHLKYAIEVEKTGSITQAADNLFMGQPNLSKAIRELESSVGITIFQRTSKGVIPTQRGAEFLSYAKAVLQQIDEMEALYRPGREDDISFRVCVPRASYIAHAFTGFVNSLDDKKNLDLSFMETNSVAAINQIAQGDCKLAIIRYQNAYEKYFLRFLEDKNQTFQTIWEFEYLALMPCAHPLAQVEKIQYVDLQDCVEILHGDLSVPSLPLTDVTPGPQNIRAKRRIYVYERGSQFDLLSSVPNAYMWVSPLPEILLSRYGLVQRRVSGAEQKYKDLLIFPKEHKLTALEQSFVDLVIAVQQEVSAKTYH